MLTQDQVERERYEARVKLHRDEISRMVAAREEGEEKGQVTGARNELAALVQQLEGMLQLPRTPSSDLQSLSLNVLRARHDALMQRLQPKP